jgi:hypothetical protein
LTLSVKTCNELEFMFANIKVKILFVYAVLSLFQASESYGQPGKRKAKQCKTDLSRTVGKKTGVVLYHLWDCPGCGREGISAKPKSKNKPAECPSCQTKIDFSNGDPTYLPGADMPNGRIIESAQMRLDPSEPSPLEVDQIHRAGLGASEAPNRYIDGQTPRASDDPEPVQNRYLGGQTPRASDDPEPAQNRYLGGQTPRTVDTGALGSRLRDRVLRRQVLIPAGAAAVGLGVWAFLDTSDYEARVKSMTWRHEVRVYEFRLQTKSGWLKDLSPHSPQMPHNGVGERSGVFNIRNHRSEYHHTEQYISHYETQTVYDTETYESGTTYSYVSNGDGTSSEVSSPTYSTRTVSRNVEVPVYADREIYETRVEYDTYDWDFSRMDYTSGVNPRRDDPQLSWPQVQLGRLEKSERIPSYSIEFEIQNDDENKPSKFKKFSNLNEGEFRSFEPDGLAVLGINIFGLVRRATPMERSATTGRGF